MASNRLVELIQTTPDLTLRAVSKASSRFCDQIEAASP
jgi:hypothetical protein